MKSKNYISGNSRKVNNFRHSGASEEGVFRTARGLFIVKVIQSGRIATLTQCEALNEAIDRYNEYKQINK